MEEEKMINLFTKKRNKKGFTLIELIVVVAILGILAAIAVPKFGAFRGDATEKAHEANVRTIESAANMYIAEHGNPGVGETYTMTEIGTLLQEVPKIPEGMANAGDDYAVSVSPDGTITVTPAR